MAHLIDDFPIKTSIYKGFSMAMLNNQMVYTIPWWPNSLTYSSLPSSKQTVCYGCQGACCSMICRFKPCWFPYKKTLSLPKRNSFRDYLSNQITLSTYIYIYIGVYIYIYIYWCIYIYTYIACHVWIYTIYIYTVYIYINLNIWILYIYIICGSSRLYRIVGLDFPSCQVHQWPHSRGQLGRWFGSAINWGWVPQNGRFTLW